MANDHKNDSDEMKLLQKANDVQEFCRSKHGVCSDCMFVRNGSDCALKGDYPRNWDI
ncbi:MAG: hypothetical protein IJT00_00945 [Lachnospiraceae bacterium]|nr:hypothetical protein [Lachnospiraceae bacterium]